MPVRGEEGGDDGVGSEFEGEDGEEDDDQDEPPGEGGAEAAEEGRADVVDCGCGLVGCGEDDVP